MTLAYDAIEAAILDRLLALTAVTNIAGTKVRADVLLPIDQTPYISVEVSEIIPVNDLNGFHGHVDSIVRVRCFSRDRKQARLLEYATRHGRIDNLGASDGLIDWDGVTIDGQSIEATDYLGTQFLTIPPEDGEIVYIFEATGSYRLRSEEPKKA